MEEFKKNLGEQFSDAVENENKLEEIRKSVLGQINDFLEKGERDEDMEWLKGKIENYDSLSEEGRQTIDEILENDPNYVRSIIDNPLRKKGK